MATNTAVYSILSHSTDPSGSWLYFETKSQMVSVNVAACFKVDIDTKHRTVCFVAESGSFIQVQFEGDVELDRVLRALALVQRGKGHKWGG